MEKRARCVNVKTKEGKLVLSLCIHPAEEILIEDKVDGRKSETKEEKGQVGNSQDNVIMTYPQKRLLFRLLADQGIEGDAAHEQLKKIFQVNSLKEISKFEASKTIERLLDEAKGGDGNGTPF